MNVSGGGRSRATWARAFTALLVCALTACSVSACDISRLQFTNDHRLSFTSPHDREEVSLPFRIAWTMKDFDPSGLDGSATKDSGVFAVFIDQAPIPVGKDIKWLARNDTSCQRDPRCPDAEYLKAKDIYITQQTSLTIDTLPPVRQGRGDEDHFVNIVLLDGTGHRLSEAGWYREFRTKRRTL